jgi:hypothetical protein
MPMFSSLQRLTWDGKAPAPFESSASVFQKVMALNSLTFRELYESIQTATSTRRDVVSELVSDVWVDFARYSALLRVEQARLRGGFLHWLGFDTVRGNPAGIRHCAECARLQYHCSLFDLAIVDRCPWHGCKVGRPCYGCVVRLQVEGVSRDGWELTSSCNCGYDLRVLFDRPVTNRITSELAARIDSNCRQLIGWWATVKQKQQGAAELLSSVMRTGTFDQEMDERRAVALGFIQDVAPLPPAWRHPVSGAIGRAVEYRTRGKPETADEIVLKREFGSVHRFIWKRYVKNHRECLESILRMPEEERQCIDAAYFCSVCVAYLAWLGPRALKRQSANGPRCQQSSVHERIMPLRGLRDDSLPRFAELALFSFMRGWAAIERKIEHWNLYIYQANHREWPRDIPRTIIDVGRTDISVDSGQRIIILRADDTLLEKRARDRCAKREDQAKAMSNANFYMNYLSFAWTRSVHDRYFWDPVRLFRIKDFSEVHGNSYSALYI